MSGKQGGSKRKATAPTRSVAQPEPPQSSLGALAEQIEFFEALGEGQGDQERPSKLPAKPPVHSLTQNTTHRRIRCVASGGAAKWVAGGRFQAPPPLSPWRRQPPAASRHPPPPAATPHNHRVGPEHQAVLPPPPPPRQ
jgi:hypothetical protein